MTVAQSSHGWLIARALAASPTVFTTIAELKDITLPGMMRNEFDATTQNINIDGYVMGVLRREATTVAINFIPGDATHDHITGLQNAIINNTLDGYKFTSPSGDTIYIHSGYVKAVKATAPVDGILGANVELRFTGKFLINGVVVGN